MTILPLCSYCIMQAIVLLIAANGAPVLANKALDKHWAWPIDNGHKLRDGQRLFGDSKTWRGLCSAIFFSSLTASLIGMELLTGALFGILTMAGDLIASFLKRRLGYPESSRMRSLDRIPESLLPTLILKKSLALSLGDIILTVIVFFLTEELVSPVLYRWRIRNKPY